MEEFLLSGMKSLVIHKKRSTMEERNTRRRDSIMQFQEYNDWPNYPTWSFAHAFEAHEDIYHTAAALAQKRDRNALRTYGMAMVRAWRDGSAHEYKDVAATFVRDVLTHLVRGMKWASLHNALRHENTPNWHPDDLTSLAYAVLKEEDWPAIVAPATNLVDADTLLMEWLTEQCNAWVDASAVQRERLHIALFADKALTASLAAVQWEHVVAAVRGE